MGPRPRVLHRFQGVKSIKHAPDLLTAVLTAVLTIGH
ncbi:hypothetical protein QEH48_gp092 [Streptomyces phage TurkishDelight]|uniref:Uncharacterized protein n=1 Tax=Streptomyces phage TurkishDelight TaxID=2793708 RepID=A0A7T0Q3E3_9CAUD|nr:hypothetical protein QEH48_gp092 [Streptomyces phage TurkishDelight]QPL14120.1 hypothetical protein SEA_TURKISHDELIGHT_92 [Streptomyces phage TurkishDelight]